MMDAVEFIRWMKRMCESYGANCDGCGLYDENAMPACMSGKSPDECIAIVEQWAKEHPVKTRQSKFLTLFPNVRTDDGGVIDLLPCEIGEVSKTKCMEFHGCAACRKAFWSEEVGE